MKDDTTLNEAAPVEERLRSLAALFLGWGGGPWQLRWNRERAALLTDAADEIERLRAALASAPAPPVKPSVPQGET